MKSIHYITILLISIQCSYAQNIDRQVIGSSGETLTNGTFQIDYTLGELAVSTISNTNILNQGFHQGELLLSIKVSPIVFLQGPSLNPNVGEETLMRDDLRVNDLLPTTSPYTDGLICNASLFDLTGNEAIVDWVWVELRDQTDNTIIIDSQSALLQRDGNVVNVDGSSTLNFKQGNGNYNIAILHQNHLGIITANPLALSGSTTALDFASDVAAALGGSNALVLLSNGTYAMYSGDFDENGQIQISDAAGIIQLIGTSGYSKADLDMNGQIQNSDVNSLLNPNIGKGRQF